MTNACLRPNGKLTNPGVFSHPLPTCSLAFRAEECPAAKAIHPTTRRAGGGSWQQALPCTEAPVQREEWGVRSNPCPASVSHSRVLPGGLPFCKCAQAPCRLAQALSLDSPQRLSCFQARGHG